MAQLMTINKDNKRKSIMLAIIASSSLLSINGPQSPVVSFNVFYLFGLSRAVKAKLPEISTLNLNI
jgi:hypothetical protein